MSFATSDADGSIRHLAANRFGRSKKLDATMRCRLWTSPECSLETPPNFREYPQEKMIERARYIFTEIVRSERD
jgi:hypothetical protein